ncbi:MAG TPA: PDR/VanB family oxidoreductase [Caulobacteraceae bacterium]|nr:PDR/VanB family oxidoreductase [Caulobacteraceae bacterium]
MQAPKQMLVVQAMRLEAQDILSVELASPSGAPLAAFTAGSHIDLHLPGGLIRSYSLVNPDTERGRYVVAVYREPLSQGGSRYVHDTLRVGDQIVVEGPRNNFAVADDGGRHVLIAGGIGVTPICSMIERLGRLDRPWTLYYCAQTAAKAAFRDLVQSRAEACDGRVVFNFDGEPGGTMLDIAALVAAQPEDAHLYCCGPKGMLEAFRAACGERPASHVHFEYFAADTHAATERSFTLVLSRSGRRLAVPEGKTILDVLLAHGVNIAYSCQQGICGACETRVISGQPDHRDQILTDEERLSGGAMMVCCSGALSDELVLDL